MGGQVGWIRSSKALLLMGAIVVLALGVSSCAKPPVAEMEAAKAAIAKAEQMEAAEYAASDLRASQDSLNKAEAELNTQNGKFALFRSYKKATALYLSAQQMAQTAEQNAVKNKEQFRQDSEAAINQAKDAIAQMKEFMATPEVARLKRGKETREALKQIEDELTAQEAVLMDQVQQMHTAEKYKQSLSMAKQVGGKVQQLMGEVQQALDAKKAIGGMKK